MIIDRRPPELVWCIEDASHPGGGEQGRGEPARDRVLRRWRAAGCSAASRTATSSAGSARAPPGRAGRGRRPLQPARPQRGCRRPRDRQQAAARCALRAAGRRRAPRRRRRPSAGHLRRGHQDRQPYHCRRESTFLIAEIGNNHNGSLEAALALIKAAAEAGADAAKFQMRDMAGLYGKRAKGQSEDLGTEYVLDLLDRFQLSDETSIAVLRLLGLARNGAALHRLRRQQCGQMPRIRIEGDQDGVRRSHQSRAAPAHRRSADPDHLLDRHVDRGRDLGETVAAPGRRARSTSCSTATRPIRRRSATST